MEITKLNESFYKITSTPDIITAIKRKFTIKKPNAYFDPMVQRGLRPDSETFYFIDPNDNNSIIIPSGLLEFVTKLDDNPEFSDSEIKEYIDNLNLPFKLYDYQEKIIIETIQKKRIIALAATGCLDPKSKINVKISKKDFEKIKKLREKSINL